MLTSGERGDGARAGNELNNTFLKCWMVRPTFFLSVLHKMAYFPE